MSLSLTQLVTVAEITQETLAVITALAPSRTEEQNTAVAADIVTWNEKRNSIAELEGNLRWKAQTLLDRIRGRTRKSFDLPLYSEEVYPTSGAVANVFVF